MSTSIIIDGKEISDKSPSYIIAEIGLNHNKSLELAKRMIKKAKESGADAVKFQTYITEKLINQNEKAFSIFKDLELTFDDFREISDYCRETGITFFSTPFSLESVDWLEKLNVPCYKIASMDINYFDLLKYAAQTGKPVILSTGMSSMGAIEKAVDKILNAGNDKIVILHTISKYPPEYSDMDMQMIKRIKRVFDFPVGFSDHTPDNTMAIVARIFGASVFEKHFTLDRSLAGPDHSISSVPEDFADLKAKLENIDKSLMEHFRERGDEEIKTGARRSLYAAVNLKKGDVLTREMISVVRPAKGLGPEYIDLIIGRKLKHDLKKGDLIELSCI